MEESDLAKDLLVAVAEAGFTVSEPQLARWHRAGLLPRPRQLSLGRGKGTATAYPPGTALQLLALCRIRHTEHSLARAGFRLWWEGYEVEADLILGPLQTSAAAIDAILGLGPPVRQPAATPADRLLSKRLGRQSVARMSDDARAALLAESPTEAVDWVAIAESPPSLQDLSGLVVRAVVSSLHGRSVREIVDGTSLEGWSEARDMAKGLLRVLQTWAGPLAWLLGQKGAALKVVSEMSSRIETQDLPHLLVAQALLAPALPAEFHEALKASPLKPPLIKELEIVQVVNELVPGAADVWTPAALRALQNGGEAAKRHQKRIDRFVAQNQDMVEKAVAEARFLIRQAD